MRLACNSTSGSGGMLASQKYLDHLWLLHGGGELALKDLLAGVEHNHAIGDLLDEAHEMFDDDDRHAGRGEPLDAPGDPVELRRIEPGGQFVKQQQPRAGGERADEVKHFLLRAV